MRLGDISNEPIHNPCVEAPKSGRMLLFALRLEGSAEHSDSSIPENSSAASTKRELSIGAIESIAKQMQTQKQSGDVLAVSIYWGMSGSREDEQRVARLLIERAGADIVHSYSSRTGNELELYEGSAIVYGRGDAEVSHAA